jgi:hypothetical protein
MAATLPEGMAALRMMRAGDELFALLRSRGGQQAHEEAPPEMERDDLLDLAKAIGAKWTLGEWLVPFYVGTDGVEMLPVEKWKSRRRAIAASHDTALSENVGAALAAFETHVENAADHDHYCEIDKGVCGRCDKLYANVETARSRVMALLSLRPQQDGELPRELSVRVTTAYLNWVSRPLTAIINEHSAHFADVQRANDLCEALYALNSWCVHLSRKASLSDVASTPSPAASPSIPEPKS